MLFNNLKIALRSLLRNRFHFSLNLTGLTLSLTAILLIALYLYHELTFDRFHQDADRIYRVIDEQRSPEQGDQRLATVAFNVSTGAREELPGVEEAVKITMIGRFLVTNEAGQRSSYEPYLAAEEHFFNVFDFPLERGDPATALVEPRSIILSQDLARRLFGEADPMGKILTTDRGHNLTVTGVFEPLPENSHLQFSCLISHNTFKADSWYERMAATDWSSNYWWTYLKLSEGSDPTVVEANLNQLAESRRTEEQRTRESRYSLQPLTDIHFYSQGIESDRNYGKSRISFVYLFGAVGFFILFIGCINYINLMTARAGKYSKEVGIRKVVGATRRKLLGRFMSESILVTTMAFVVAFLLVNIGLPRFNQFIGQELSLDLLGEQTPLLFFLLGLLLFMSLASGIYPAFYLSRFDPVRVLKDKLPAGSGNFNLRRGLVVFQFVLSSILITGTLVAFSQMQYIQQKNLGFNEEQVLVADINSGKVRSSFAAIKEGYEQLPGVSLVSVSSRVPGEWKGIPEVQVQQPDHPEMDPILAYFIGADEDFLSTFEAELLTGRNFRGDAGQDSTAVLINEEAARVLGIDQPEGQELLMPCVYFGGDGGEIENPFRARVVGIVKNFHFQSLYEPIRPLVIAYRNNPIHSIDYFTARLHPGDVEATLASMESILLEVDPSHIFEYHFLDEQLARFYEADKRRGELFTAATLFAIFIACLGLFGLAAFTAERRTKEIGIRKVLGATAANIVTLLSKEFIWLVGLALLIGLPVSWWAVQQWLENFAYNIGIRWWMFAIPFFLSIAIALLTVSYHAFRAALRNPVEALRCE
jgi:putative ABC transport system permease protein